jgi:hypothetical protein
MDFAEVFPAVLKAVAAHSPVILASLAGCVVVGTRWRALAGAAVPALLGFGLAFLLSAGTPILWTVLPRIMQDRGSNAMASLFPVIGFVISLIWAAALVLLILGVSQGRTQVSPVVS